LDYQTIIIIAILGAVWRVVDGGDNKPTLWHTIPIAVVPVVFFTHSYELALATLITTIAMLDGFKDWTDFGYMSMRFTGYCALCVALADTHPMFISLGLLVGLLYPIGALIQTKIKTLKYTVVCEALTGGLLFGFLAYNA